jgi:predicted phage terminase large subunit-like protein
MRGLSNRIRSAEKTVEDFYYSSSHELPNAEELLKDFLQFTKYFYKLRTGREFVISRPGNRQSHHEIIAKELTEVYEGKHTRSLIHCPPRYGKTEMMIHFVAWTLAKYPDSQYIYISYALRLAAKQTAIIRQIVNLPQYKAMFGVEIRQDSRAKDFFETTSGGAVYASGAGGSITGSGGGLANTLRWGGAFIIDDIHKPSEVTSDTIRESEVGWYIETAQSRLNNPQRTPVIGMGQILHESDLFSQLAQGLSGEHWDILKIKALDDAGNPLDSTKHTKEDLTRMEKTMPYVFASQYQQTPQPAGGGIFKKDWFTILEGTPKILSTFVTSDTAETDKNYNDATVFSFWGVYKIEQAGIQTDIYGLHWLDCLETWVEPKDLKSTFLSFYADCMRFSVKPKLAAIEKKSTGVTLVSILKSMQGLQIHEIERTAASGSKTARFLESQPIVASGQLSFTSGASHMHHCIEHMSRITANDTHRRDDIADTCADAIKLALIDNFILNFSIEKKEVPVIAGYEPFYKTNVRQIRW